MIISIESIQKNYQLYIISFGILLATRSTIAFLEAEQIEQKYESGDENEPLQALSNDQSTQQIHHQQDEIDRHRQHLLEQQQQQQHLFQQQQQNEQNNLQSQQPQQQQSISTITHSEQNRLNEIFHRLTSQSQMMPKSFGEEAQAAASSSYSHHLSSSSSSSSASSAATDENLEASSSDYGSFQPLQTLNEGISKFTKIPQGSLFAFPDKNGKLEFESMYAKQPYSIVFRTQSMPVKIKQQHHTLPAPEVEFVRSQEEAHRIKHEVIRPVIQEVHEIIQPYRRVVQEVRPVIENVHTIVAKGEPRGGKAGGPLNGPNDGAYNDNIRGSYSENLIRFVPVPSEQQQQQQQQSKISSEIDQSQSKRSHHQIGASLSNQNQPPHYINSHQQSHHRLSPVTHSQARNFRNNVMDSLRPNKLAGRFMHRRY